MPVPAHNSTPVGDLPDEVQLWRSIVALRLARRGRDVIARSLGLSGFRARGKAFHPTSIERAMKRADREIAMANWFVGEEGRAALLRTAAATEHVATAERLRRAGEGLAGADELLTLARWFCGHGPARRRRRGRS
jgi:hypothetical protein